MRLKNQKRVAQARAKELDNVRTTALSAYVEAFYDQDEPRYRAAQKVWEKADAEYRDWLRAHALPWPY